MADTPPDLTPYIDPPLLDLDAQTIFEDALGRARALLPGWVPVEGNTEVVLMQALALSVSELIFAVNRVPAAVTMAVLGRLFELDRDLGAPTRGRVRFDVADDTGREVPMGTRIQLDVGLDSPLAFTTDEALLVPPGSRSGEVNVSAVELGVAGNGTPPGRRFDLVDALAFVDGAVLVSTLAGGRDAENAEAYLDRGATHMRRLVNTLLLPEHFELAALSWPGVGRARAVDLLDPTSGNAAGLDPGHVTVAALAVDGSPLTADAKAALVAELSRQAAAFLHVHVVDPTVTNVDVNVAVVLESGADAATVEVAAAEAVRAYLNPLTWRWSGTVRQYELVALIANVPGVDYVSTILTPTGNVTLAGAAPLAQAGSVTVTAVNP